MHIPDPDEGYRPEAQANKLAEAVIDCQDHGMTYEDIDEVTRAAMEANAPKKIT